MRLVVKSKSPIGTISMHGGRKMRKVAEGKWLPVSHGRKRSLANEHDIQQIRQMFGKRPQGQGKELPITSKHDLELILTQTTFCMISAGRNPESEADKALSDKQIIIRDAKLKADLLKSGYVITPSKGKYGQEEKSLLVMTHDANKKEMMALGARYNQDSVLFTVNGHSELIFTTGPKAGKPDMAGDGHEYVPDAEDFYTELPIANEKIKFVMNLAEIAKSLWWMLVGLLKSKGV